MDSETKRIVFERLLEVAQGVFVYYVPGDDVVVPAGIDPDAPLLYGLNLPKPVRFFGSLDEGIGAELSFGRPVYTYLPWDRVKAFAVTGAEGCLVHFPVVTGAEKVETPAKAAAPASAKSETVKVTKTEKRSHLRLVTPVP
jgi:hypothetical protein